MSKFVAQDFFTEEEKQRIIETVQETEKRTSGEVVPMVVDSSYDYPRTDIVGGGLFSLGMSTFLTWFLAHESLWVFLALFVFFYGFFKRLIHTTPMLKRRLVNPKEMEAEVEEKAMVSFLEQGIHRTRDETGILILISLFERRVHVLADRGINNVVPKETWDEIVQTVTKGIHEGQTCEALCKAIRRCGDLLEENFPVKHDDTDELPNLILG